MEKKFTTKEVVVVAMVAAVIGVIYTSAGLGVYADVSSAWHCIYGTDVWNLYAVGDDADVSGAQAGIRHLWRAGDRGSEPASGKPLWSAACAGRIPGGTCC